MRRKSYILFAIVLGGSLSSACLAIDDGPKARATSVLIRKYETIFYSSSEIQLDSGVHGRLSTAEARRLSFPFAYLEAALSELQGGIFADMLNDSDGILQGAREFRSPQGSLGLGAVRSRRCYIVLLKSGSRFNLQKYFQTAQVPVAVHGLVWNWPVYIDEFTEKSRDVTGASAPRLSSLHATQVGDQFVLVSNDLKDLQSIAATLTAWRQGSPEVPEIEDWDDFSRSGVWAYRRYRRGKVADRMAAGMQDVTSDAKAISFVLDSAGNALLFRLLLNSAEGERTVVKMNSNNHLPPLKQIRKDLWESIVPIPGDSKTEEAVFSIVGLFGFADYS